MASERPVTQVLDRAWAFLAVALLAALIGSWAMNTEPKAGAVKCENGVMSPGDTCAVYREPGHVLVRTDSYDDVKQRVRNGNIAVGWVAFAGAGALVVAGGVYLAKYARATRDVTFTKAEHDKAQTTWVMGMWAVGFAVGISAGRLVGGGLGWLVAIGGSLLLAFVLSFAAVKLSDWRFEAVQRAVPV